MLPDWKCVLLSLFRLYGKNHSAAMPPEGSTRAGILPGCPSLDRGSREAEVGVRTMNLPCVLLSLFRLYGKNHSAAMPPEGSTRAGILPGCPSIDRRSREAEVGFEPRTFWSVNSRSDHLSHLAPSIV
ncbi:hypothetical protein T265_07105 [Opisthorchis viverrini]|uniref:Uncharacterized protein n=1 Tax=Opisthorchis viverrini TaxID=6198 RepID=A0A074ZE25_OPIVI|nr:hypothetical protein T265_07105 [Opisthorchis viverrini]KER25423.1 hypothetical protein T265_07105 [Opisthorchis viverrini]